MRSLHLIEPWHPHAPQGSDTPSDAHVLRCAASIRAQPHGEHVVLVVGAGEAEARARMLGLPTPHRLSLVLGRPASARRGFARFAGAHGPFDSVRCWSPRLADLVVDSGLGHQRFFPLPASSDPDEASRVARLFPARVRAPHRPWTIALLNDPPTLVNALNAVHAGGLLEKSGHRCTIVVDQAATHWIQACRLARDIRLKLDLVRSACVIAELHRFDAVGMIGTRATPEASFLADVIRAVGVPLVTAPSPMLVARALLPLASLALSGVPA